MARYHNVKRNPKGEKFPYPLADHVTRVSVEREEETSYQECAGFERYYGARSYGRRVRKTALIWESPPWEDEPGIRVEESDKGGWLRIDYTGDHDEADLVLRSNTRVFREDFKSQKWEREGKKAGRPVPNWLEDRDGRILISISWYMHPTKGEDVRNWIAKLDDYPLADDDDHSQLQMEQESEQWEDWGRDEFRREVSKYLQFRFNQISCRASGKGDGIVKALAPIDANMIYLAPDGVLGAQLYGDNGPDAHLPFESYLSADDVMDRVTDDDIDRLYQALCEKDGQYTEFESNGSAIFHTEIVWGHNGKTDDPGRDAWDGLFPDRPVEGAPPVSFAPFGFERLPCARCGKLNPTEDTLGIWSVDCTDPLCDCPEQAPNANPALADIARQAMKLQAEGKGKAFSEPLDVLEDAYLERGAGKRPSWKGNYEGVQVRIREWLKTWIVGPHPTIEP